MTTDTREGALVSVLASLLSKHRLDRQVEPGLRQLFDGAALPGSL
ncbi:hypothetical protein RE6C_02345 [Rhodopirellula europaea 6C]|uniref:Uncharacterized protein n=1 Tax=Rhodopirellula europaea 6C TaxID=1263867 RepID=M2AW75_9BACT|nr:hypothetical protein RE6C_02345 [Rhodopirellula europaea 6C]